ncbi:hypothetical protein TRFO_37622 [Tritrichomonas foetus]|uniref:Uncharacterized protein n=1 Tax=Tritrichomonas foetus TaxID=1144522 RepID=A0A1J4JFJ8_9EUKA|nr:hypothetical protein TRFO_37622 [Tritrichomonas foetus]|eukprot:OHS96237.1 hypothetical protein TRFO_37622 [Tritrichomonas foetus]
MPKSSKLKSGLNTVVACETELSSIMIDVLGSFLKTRLVIFGLNMADGIFGFGVISAFLSIFPPSNSVTWAKNSSPLKRIMYFWVTLSGILEKVLFQVSRNWSASIVTEWAFAREIHESSNVAAVQIFCDFSNLRFNCCWSEQLRRRRCSVLRQTFPDFMDG